MDTSVNVNIKMHSLFYISMLAFTTSLMNNLLEYKKKDDNEKDMLELVCRVYNINEGHGRKH